MRMTGHCLGVWASTLSACANSLFTFSYDFLLSSVISYHLSKPKQNLAHFLRGCTWDIVCSVKTHTILFFDPETQKLAHFYQFIVKSKNVRWVLAYWSLPTDNLSNHEVWSHYQCPRIWSDSSSYELYLRVLHTILFRIKQAFFRRHHFKFSTFQFNILSDIFL